MSQGNLFLIHMFELGIWFSILYDGLRILRRAFPRRILWVSLEDIVFWIYCGAKVFVLMQRESNGNLRWYGVLAALVGMWLYLKLVSVWLVKYSVKGLRIVVSHASKLLQRGKAPLKKWLTGCRRKARIGLEAAGRHGEDS